MCKELTDMELIDLVMDYNKCHDGVVDELCRRFSKRIENDLLPINKPKESLDIAYRFADTFIKRIEDEHNVKT